MSEKIIHKGLHHAKLAVMRDVDYLQKKKSPAGGINYAFLGEEAIVNAIHASFVENNLTVTPIKFEVVKTDTFTTSKGSAMNHVVLLTTYRLTHADSGESEEGMSIGEGMDTGDKAANKASTGSLKYYLRQAFLIPSGNDPDKFSSDDMQRGSHQPRESEMDPEVARTWVEWATGIINDVQKADIGLLEKITKFVEKEKANCPSKEMVEIKMAIEARAKALLGKK